MAFWQSRSRKPNVKDLVRQVKDEIGEDHTMAFAGSLAFSCLLSVFPLLLLIVSLLAAVRATDFLLTGLDQLSATIPADASSLIREQIIQLTTQQSGSVFTVSAIVAGGLALWGVSGAVRASMQALNVMYDLPEPRPFLARYAASLVLSLVVASILIIALTLVVAGADIASYLADQSGSLGVVFVAGWSVLQWPALVMLAGAGFGLLYRYSPAQRQTWRHVMPGAIFTTSVWVLFSIGFSIYIDNFSSYNATYGSIAGVIVLILYLYYSALVFLIGAQINQVLAER